MSNFGELLRHERERHNVSLSDIARETKINLRYLEALENEDFQFLPGGAFDKGYVRSYAEYLRVDPEPLLRAFAEARRDGEADAGDPADGRPDAAATVAGRMSASHLGGTGARSPWLMVGIVAVVVVLAGGGWWLSSQRDAADSPAMVATTAPGVTTTEIEPLDPESEPREVEQPAVEPIVQSTPESVPRPAADPAPPVETRPQPQESSSAASPVDLEVPDFGVGEAVADHQLQGESDRFVAGESVWFWTRVVGGGPGEHIRHVWMYEGTPVQSIELEVGAAHWRTHSRKTIWETGAWTVEARDAEDRVLARADFICVPRG